MVFPPLRYGNAFLMRGGGGGGGAVWLSPASSVFSPLPLVAPKTFLELFNLQYF